MNAADTKEHATFHATVGEESSGRERERILAEAHDSLVRTAELAASAGVDLDRFMAAAFSAYLRASPAAREHFESMQLMAQLDELRRRGALAAA